MLGRLVGVREPARTLWLDRPRAFGVEWLTWLRQTHPEAVTHVRYFLNLARSPLGGGGGV